MRFLTRGLAGLCLCMLFLLAGCESIRPPQAALSLPAAEVPDRFQVDGRLSVREAGKGQYVQFDWQREGRRDTVDLVSPLGQVLARLEIDDQQALLVESNGQRHEAESADLLASQLLGQSLPLAGLRYWLVGQAAPGAFDWVSPDHVLLRQDGWQIEFEYHDGTRLPRRINLSRQDLSVRVVLSGWQTLP